MRFFKKMQIGLGILTSLFLVNAAFADASNFAQFTNSSNQMASTSVKQVNISDNQSSLKITADGTYFILAAGQVGASGDKDITDEYVDLWMTLNGKKIPNSNARQTVSSKNFTAVLVTQTVMNLKEGDTIGIDMLGSSSSVGLITIPGNSKMPTIPSIIFSAYKI